MRVCRGDEVVLEQTSSSSGDALRSVAGDILDLDQHRHRSRQARERWMVEEISKRRPDSHQRHARHDRDSGLSEDSCDDTGRTEFGRRCVCSRTLRRQQRQLDQVTALCRRALTRNQSSSDDQQPTTPTRRQSMKIKSSECETYNLIVNKLEELQRLYATRPPVTPAEVTQCYRVTPEIKTTPRPPKEGRLLDTDSNLPTGRRCRETAVGSSLPKLLAESPESILPEHLADKHRRTSACCLCMMLHRWWCKLKQLLTDFT